MSESFRRGRKSERARFARDFTILYKLELVEEVMTIPTIEINVEAVEYKATAAPTGGPVYFDITVTDGDGVYDMQSPGIEHDVIAFRGYKC